MEKEVQVLDVGCGDGYGTYKLSLTGYKAVGVDLSEVMIQKGKERGEGPNLSFIKVIFLHYHLKMRNLKQLWQLIL